MYILYIHLPEDRGIYSYIQRWFVRLKVGRDTSPCARYSAIVPPTIAISQQTSLFRNMPAYSKIQGHRWEGFGGQGSRASGLQFRVEDHTVGFRVESSGFGGSSLAPFWVAGDVPCIVTGSCPAQGCGLIQSV